ncbi:MAG TPA: hypothetical protein VE777_01975 [Gaiellales bacterium]|nr:hypothetical protein [Gaiellales bacterium]
MLAYRAAMRLPRHGHAERRATSRAELYAILDRWSRRLRHYQRAYAHRRPILDGLLCIHSYEGAWTSVSATIPTYYGGLQMDLSFEQTYGADVLAYRGGANANEWPAHDQLMVGVRAYKVRGWTPWPNSAAMCGLL